MGSAETTWNPIGSANHKNGKLYRDLCPLSKHNFLVSSLPMAHVSSRNATHDAVTNL